MSDPAGGDVPGLAIYRYHLADPYERPRDLASDVIRDLANDYHEACRRSAAAWRLVSAKQAARDRDQPCPWEPWANIACNAKLKAEDMLIEAITTLFGKGSTPDRDTAECREWDPCSFEIDGRIYVVSQHPDTEQEYRPVLTVLDVHLHTDADWMDAE